MPKEKKKRWKQPLRIAGKAFKYSLLAGLAFHCLTQTAYMANDIINAVKPSRVRSEFEDRFGFSIYGWKDHIEEWPQNVSIISDVIQREKITKDFRLRSLTIFEENYHKKSFIDQMKFLISDSPRGYYINDDINISEEVPRSTLHHEIKHAKAFDIMAAHPEFRKRWESLSEDRYGNSLYLNSSEQFCAYMRWLDFLVDEEKKDLSDNQSLGFITNYARTNVHEDIAELCEAVESEVYTIRKILSDKDNPGTKIIRQKMSLALEYGLIPEDFMDFLRLKDLYREGKSYFHTINFEKMEIFMDESQRFLNKNPDSVYESDIRSKRAYVLRQGIHSYPEPRNTIEDAIREYKLVLASDYKRCAPYAKALRNLKEIYKHNKKDDIRSEIMDEAHRRYWKRFRSGDSGLAAEGVNDFLKENGIDINI